MKQSNSRLLHAVCARGRRLHSLPRTALLLALAVLACGSAFAAPAVHVQPQLGHSGPVRSIAISPDGSILATGGADDNIILWEVSSGREIRVMQGHADEVLGLAFAPEGARIASASADKTLKVWDIATGKVSHTFSRGQARMTSVAFTPDGLKIVSGNSNGLLGIWPLNRSEPPMTIAEHRKAVEAVAVSPDGEFIASGSRDHRFLLRRAGGGASSVSFLEHASWVRSLCFSPDGKSLATGGHDQLIQVVDTVWRRPPLILRGHQGSVEAVSFTPDGKRIVSAGGDMTLRVWDFPAGKERNRFALVGKRVRSIAVSPDGRSVATANADATATLYDLATGKVLRTFGGKQWSGPSLGAGARLVDLASADKIAVTATSDNALIVWDIVAGAQQRRLQGVGTLKGGFGLSPKGDILAAGIDSNVITFWDVSSGALVRTEQKLNADESFITFNKTGERLYTQVAGAIMKRRMGDALVSQVVNGGRHHPVVLSPDGEFALRDHGSIVQTSTRKEIHALAGHGGRTTASLFTSSGRQALTIGEDNTMRLWDISSGQLVATFVDLGEAGWVVVTPEGYFNASSLEAADAVSVSQGTKTYAMAEFWDVFYRPDLVRKKISGASIAAETGGMTFAQALKSPAPKELGLTLASPSPESASTVRLNWSVKDVGGGIGDIRVFQNGKLVQSIPRTDIKSESRAGSLDAEVLAGRENTFALVAYNAANTIQSLPAKQSFVSALKAPEPQLWIIPVGINNYRTPHLATLNNARKDASDFVCAYAGKNALGDSAPGCMEQGVAETVFKRRNIHVLRPLYNAGADRGKILEALASVARQARPADTVIWFISSHGLLDSKGMYSFAPYDVVCKNTRCSDFTGHISSADILEQSTGIKAMTQLVILDTCHAGGMDAGFSALYDARITTLAKNMGLHLFASTQATELASDGRENGVFTKELLDGLRGGAKDANNDGFISIVELGAHARRQTIAGSAGDPLRGGEGASLREPARPNRATQVPVITHFGKDAALMKAR